MRNYRSQITLFLPLLWLLISCGTLQQVSKTRPHPEYSPLQQAEMDKVAQAPWTTKRVGKSIQWKAHHFSDLFGSRQYINVLEMDMTNKLLKADLIFAPKGLIHTSDVGKKNKASAAINGGFFKRDGSSSFFLKKGGRILQGEVRRSKEIPQHGAVSIYQGKLSIITRPEGGWQTSLIPTLLASGPLLLKDGSPVKPSDTPFNNRRHPRTAIGTTPDGRVIAVVIDGRHGNSQGATIEELSLIMRALGCNEALNLDGGGSSTMWVEGYGVVNHPSDNRNWDSKGERAVANVLLFTYKGRS